MFIFAAPLSLQIQLPKTVSFESRACPLSQALDGLSSKTSLSLGAADELGRQICLINLHEAPTEAALDRIALVFAARWDKDGSRWKLIPNPVALKEKRERTKQQRLAAFTAAMKPILDRGTPKFDQAAASALLHAVVAQRQLIKDNPRDVAANKNFAALQTQSPYGRLLTKLLKTISPSTLAEIPSNSRTVFSLHPTKRQLPFGPGAADAMKEFLVEQRLWSEQVSQVKLDPDDSMTVSDPLSQGGEFEDDPKNIDVVVTNWRPDSFNCNLRSTAPYGFRVMTQLSVQSPAVTAAYENLYSGDKNPGKKISPSPESAILQNLLSSRFGDSSKLDAIDDRAKTFLLDPVKYDPLSFYATDAVLALAEPKAENIIAWMPDELFASTIISKEGLTAEGVRQLLGSVCYSDISEGDGWLTITPRDPDRTMRNLEPREALRTVCRAIDAKGGLRLIDFAQYAAQVDHGAYDGLGVGYIFTLDPAAGSVMDGSDWDVLRLYGSLSAQQRQTLAAGQNIAFSSLSSRQKTLVDILSFRREISNSSTTSDHSYTINQPQQEPTVVLQNGVPADGFLSMATDHQDLLFAYSKDASGKLVPSRSVNEETIAMFEDLKAHPDGNPMRGQLEMVAFQVGTQDLHRIRLNYFPKTWNEYRMIENVPPDKGPVPWTQLDASRVSKIKESLKRREEQRNKGDQTSPPPPAR